MALCPTCQTNRGPWDETCAKCGFSYKELDAQKSAAGAKAAAVTAGCPACGVPRAAGDESCPGCGVVYAKWKPREERLPAAASGAASSSAPLLGADVKKDRPGCLTLMLAATILVNGAAIFLLPIMDIPGISVGPMIFLSAAMVVCAIGVLFWKTWAVYALVIIELISIGFAPTGTSVIVSLIQPAVALGLLYYFITPVWHHFD